MKLCKIRLRQTNKDDICENYRIDNWKRLILIWRYSRALIHYELEYLLYNCTHETIDNMADFTKIQSSSYLSYFLSLLLYRDDETNAILREWKIPAVQPTVHTCKWRLTFSRGVPVQCCLLSIFTLCALWMDLDLGGMNKWVEGR